MKNVLKPHFFEEGSTVDISVSFSENSAFSSKMADYGPYYDGKDYTA
jgi:hypothetical protein